MREVDLRMEENHTYQIIKKLVDTEGNKNSAALKLGCTKRHINRMIQGYKVHGKDYFQHGNRGKQPAHTLSKELRQMIIDLYLQKYYGANFTHFCELLKKNECIITSESTIRTILMAEKIISPMATRIMKKEIKRQLEEASIQAKSKKEQSIIQARLVAIEDAPPKATSERLLWRNDSNGRFS